MKYREFLEYLEKNLDGYRIFISKALDYQREKNSKRQAKNRWDDDKLRKAAYDMWKASMETLYYKIKAEVKSDSPFIWRDFIESQHIFENLNDGINEIDFSDDGAA